MLSHYQQLTLHLYTMHKKTMHCKAEKVTRSLLLFPSSVPPRPHPFISASPSLPRDSFRSPVTPHRFRWLISPWRLLPRDATLSAVKCVPARYHPTTWPQTSDKRSLRLRRATEAAADSAIPPGSYSIHGHTLVCIMSWLVSLSFGCL